MTDGAFTFSRRGDHRVAAGVAGGFADQHGIDPFVVRASLVVLSFAGGLGAVLYALGYAVSDPPVDRRPVPPSRDQFRNISVGLISLGLLLVVRSTGLWLGDALMVPLVVVASGLAVLGAVRPSASNDPWGGLATTRLGEVFTGAHARTRIFVGAGLVAIGLILVGAGRNLSSGLRGGVFATALTVVGIAVLLGPWFSRAAQEIADERRQRIRSEEREAVAAHLHDSVLQTLALIQRSAHDPRRTISLARRQEHELRDWLYGQHDTHESHLAASVRAMTHEVEGLYDVRIDAVIVGDRAMDDTGVALTAALREACVNAAKHSGVNDVSLFVEVGSDAIEAFVRDRGTGFDRAAAPPDRHGISQSIEARIERTGGTATISSTPGTGTEVRLRVPATLATSELLHETDR